MLEILLVVAGLFLVWRHIVLAQKVRWLRLEVEDLTEEIVDERRDCVFWMRVSEQMEKSGGTSRLLNQRREGRRIVNQVLAGKI